MLVTTGWVILSGIWNFNAALAFDLPPDAFNIDLGFIQGLVQGTAEVLYRVDGYPVAGSNIFGS